MRVQFGRLAAAVLAGVALLAIVAGVASADPGSRTEVPGDTIVRVTGDKEYGFRILHYDGTTLYPPTISEARAECAGYARRVRRVRCRTEVRVWYGDLGDLQQALTYANRRARGH